MQIIKWFPSVCTEVARKCYIRDITKSIFRIYLKYQISTFKISYARQKVGLKGNIYGW